MRYSTIVLAAMPGFFALTSGLGNFQIKNSCGTDVHYVHDFGTCEEVLIIKPGVTTDPCTYLAKQDGAGPSVKMSRDPTVCHESTPITQFEYTIGWREMVFTDLSNINGNPYPFLEGGVRLTSSDNSVNVLCPAGVVQCAAAYNNPQEDWATQHTAENADLLVEVCYDKPGAYGGDLHVSDNKGLPVTQPDPPKPANKLAQAPPGPQKQPDKLAAPPAPPSSTPSPPPPPPPPSSTAPPPPPPSPSPVQQEEDVVVEVEVIVTITETAPTVWVTEYAGDNKAKKRNQDHVHQHVHNKIHKKRHGGA